MEKLFRDLHIEELDRVPLAAHCLEKDAYSWWISHFERKLGSIYPSWEEFRRLLYEQYFKDSTKQSLERELERLKQGNRTVGEYERDFSRIVSLIPFVVRDEYHKARMFARGLKPSIRLLIASHGALTFDERTI
ncbi:Retrotransposon gag protein [Macrophomina phaseolina MS6]|uniref:Retrotransposon gag protein n=1 Tax=Macrophomina phaseolina (strain MS6) TaxID=1126212 RepID=K2R7L8_MACPH|nr:Retrotransposon gag protein [Macrophomina phaseolina MS6]